jgi:hypothetical protein
MIKRVLVAALGFTVVAIGHVSLLEAKNGKELRGAATWTVPAPAPCGPFSTLLVHSTQFDASVLEAVYQFGNSCDGSFHIVQGSGTGSVTGNLQHLRMHALVPTSDDRTIDVDITLHRTKDLADRSPNEKVVSARASGTVILDRADLTGGAATNDATITETRTK